MSLLETILSAQGGNLIKNLGSANGIDPQQALAVLGKLVPGLSQGLNTNSRKSGGLDALFGAMQKGNHRDYLEDSKKAYSAQGILDGNGILGHILGSKDASRSLASQVSAQTGVGSSIIKKMLPQIATMVMGAMGSQSRSSGALGGLAGMLGGGQQKQAGGLLTAFLDRDNDGSIVDDLMAMAAKQLIK
jgi:hypothetical protein